MVNLYLFYYFLVVLFVMLVLWFFSEIMAPFAIGAVLAYLSDPLADKLETFGINRLATALVLSIVTAIIIMLLAILILPMIFNQAYQILEMMPEMIEAVISFGSQWLAPLNVSYINEIGIENFNSSINELSPILLRSFFTSSAAVFDFILLLIVAPIVFVYLLVDWNKIVETLKTFVPIRIKPVVYAIVLDMHNMIAAFIRGQMVVCLILATFYAISLALLGLQYGLLLGIFSGLVSFIPLFGALIGGLLALLVSLFQFWDSPEWIAFVMAIFLFGQLLEGNILTPRLVGRSVKLHPLWIIFSIGFFSSCFGWVGVVIAVPLAACLAVLMRFFIKMYFQSDFYKS